MPLSQSPYGAKWFATVEKVRPLLPGSYSRNPLTGLSGLQQEFAAEVVLMTDQVAIPLRG